MALLSEQTPGSIVKIKENDVLVDFLVLQQGYPQTGNGNVLLLRNDCVAKKVFGTNNAYLGSTVDNYLTSNYISTLDQSIANKIPDVTIKYTIGDGSSSTSTLTRKIFLLSYTELGFSGGVYYNVEGSKIPYFSNNNLRIAKYNSSAVRWWTRTPHTYLTDDMVAVNTDGSFNNNTGSVRSSFGVRPAFCLPGTAFVLETGEVVFNQPPTVPTNFSVPPTIFSEYDTPISWGASTDPEGALAGYILERKLNGGEWAELYRGSALKYNDKTVPFGSSTVQYRVCAYDTENLQSDYAESAVVTVTNNRPPVVTGSDTDLGTLTTTPPSITYTATDPDPGDTITVTITLDETQLESKTVVSGEEQSFSVPADKWLEVLNGAHTLTVTAADQQGANGTRTWTMTKAVTQISVQAKDPVQTEEMCRRAVLDMTYALPEGAEIKVEMCNNALDDSPAWEDMTSAFLNGEKFFFQNQTKTAANWAYSWRITLNRNGQTGECWLFGGTGACD